MKYTGAILKETAADRRIKTSRLLTPDGQLEVRRWVENMGGKEVIYRQGGNGALKRLSMARIKQFWSAKTG